jgi:AcrR family transcriptional regulator
LNAAEEVIRDQGARHMSLEAVAERAEISKGGLLYNFPSKTALLSAMVELHLAQRETAMLEAEQRLDGTPNKAVRAHLATKREKCEAHEGPPPGILAAFLENPELIEPIRRYNELFVARGRKAEDPDLCMMAFLAVAGAEFLTLLDAMPYDEDEYARMIERLDGLLKRRNVG